MSVFFREGESKRRPGVYMRYENIGPNTAGEIFSSIPPQGGADTPDPPDNIVNSGDYESLADAIEAAENGATVVISGNTQVTSPIRIPEGKSITLQVPENVTLNLAAGEGNYALVVKGGLTIEGEGDISITGFGIGTSIGTDGKLTIKSGHFIANGCDYIIGCFDGEVVIEGGVFDGEYCVVNNFSETYNTDGVVQITGGFFNTSQEDGFDVLGGNVEIAGGQFSKPVNPEHAALGFEPVEADGYYTVE